MTRKLSVLVFYLSAVSACEKEESDGSTQRAAKMHEDYLQREEARLDAEKKDAEALAKAPRFVPPIASGVVRSLLGKNCRTSLRQFGSPTRDDAEYVYYFERMTVRCTTVNGAAGKLLFMPDYYIKRRPGDTEALLAWIGINDGIVDGVAAHHEITDRGIYVTSEKAIKYFEAAAKKEAEAVHRRELAVIRKNAASAIDGILLGARVDARVRLSSGGDTVIITWPLCTRVTIRDIRRLLEPTLLNMEARTLVCSDGFYESISLGLR